MDIITTPIHWVIEDTGNGCYRLLARNSNKALTVVTNSQDEGANVLQQEWSGTDGQQWRMEIPEEVVTGVDENSSGRFSVFPNPAKALLTISGNLSGEMNESTLTDLLGREVYRETVTGKSEWSVSTSNFPAGLYFLRIKSKQVEFTTKVIIVK